MRSTEIRPFAYSPMPLAAALTYDEIAKAALAYYAQTRQHGTFAESLLRQHGRWSEKQKLWVNKFISSHDPIRREREAEEWLDGCVRTWIAEVGTDNAATHAEELLKFANDYERMAEQGEYNCESHTKWTKRAWDAHRHAAATAREKANRIRRILDTMNKSN